MYLKNKQSLPKIQTELTRFPILNTYILFINNWILQTCSTQLRLTQKYAFIKKSSIFMQSLRNFDILFTYYEKLTLGVGQWCYCIGPGQ